LKEYFKLIEEGIRLTTTTEWIAVLCNILYVIFIAKEKVIGWFFGFFGAIIYIYLCFVQKLYLESFLQLFYAVMAIIGFINWNKSVSKPELSKNKTYSLTEWNLSKHVIWISIITISVVIIGYIFKNFTNQENPYVDAFTTLFSLFATFLVIKKVVSNWLYWIVVNIFSIYLYLDRTLVLTAFLYLIMTFIAIYGWRTWRSQFIRNDQNSYNRP
jgi:nicotinamide mononucleotide transporter